MSKRKGELSTARIDREWPHQVAILDDLCCRENYWILDAFCRARSASPRARSVIAIWPDGKLATFRIYCFQERVHAQEFIKAFGGEPFDPSDRAKGRKDTWFRTDEWRPILESGPLRVPDSLRG
ncbi:hypothetical protein [Aquamicrobium sp. LC103]|uniref:hypothetical protein n=1 Tax=Aquamicrobium sp. LC103 TaxID=1120658 RepID=UPI000A639B1D|nr:hypothetical protein [Aquamicrobium sp. LC103]TKT79027.1 hypothetical protein XW59_008790 [Aquamicrobium sp. LC103]